MATHSSTLAWKTPWTEEPGRLQSMGSLGVGHDWATSLSLFTFMHWRRKWQPTPVFLPGESQGQGSLVGCCLWGHTESDTTEAMQQQQQQRGTKAPKATVKEKIQHTFFTYTPHLCVLLMLFMWLHQVLVEAFRNLWMWSSGFSRAPLVVRCRL